MDYLVESIVLGVDSIFFLLCLRNYYKSKNAIAVIQEAPYLSINNNLKEVVITHPDKKLPYVSLRGIVKPLGKPIISINNSDVEGVVQLLSIKEHVVQRGTSGYWNEAQRVIQDVHNFMQFSIENKGVEVEVVDPLAADILDMDLISDVFHPTNSKFVDHIWGFFFGIRQRGIQTTEMMLRKGTMITGIGELVCSKEGNTLQLQPPSNGAPFYLTKMSVTSLVNKLESSKRNSRFICFILGTIGVVIGGYMIHKYLKRRIHHLKNAEIKKQLAEYRKERRKKNRSSEINEDQTCVVCRVNPLEIIVLPCGHVCLCEDCSDDIKEFCPVCRSPIQTRSAAYVA